MQVNYLYQVKIKIAETDFLLSKVKVRKEKIQLRAVDIDQLMDKIYDHYKSNHLLVASEIIEINKIN